MAYSKGACRRELAPSSLALAALCARLARPPRRIEVDLAVGDGLASLIVHQTSTLHLFLQTSLDALDVEVGWPRLGNQLRFIEMVLIIEKTCPSFVALDVSRLWVSGRRGEGGMVLVGRPSFFWSFHLRRLRFSFFRASNCLFFKSLWSCLVTGMLLHIEYICLIGRLPWMFRFYLFC